MTVTTNSLEPDAKTRSSRIIQSLDGLWQIAEGTMDSIPSSFERTVPVPGLVSLAQPPFIEPGPAVVDRNAVPQKDPRRDAFWYRRTFRLDALVPEVAKLKVYKAMFGACVILNGKRLGEHLPCFTPGYFDAREALKTGENELLIRIGADRDSVSGAIPSGFDFEKERYIPGIFDSVELILSGTPHIVNVQTAPDIESKTVRVQALVHNAGEATDADLKFVIREAKSRRTVGTATAAIGALAHEAEKTVEVRIPVANCRLWSPEDPFLYHLEVESGADCFETRFGMREFHFDHATGRAVLNGRPYFMRGSNITLYRFFEDSQCSDLPWRNDWVRELHRSFKNFHWNSLRYCIGFPPEAWYRIADEEGFLIQDEFPIWFASPAWAAPGGPNPFKWPAELNHEELVREYTEWMRERWNHPCVVVWDAQNETESPETALAIRQVRALDLSNRPWDNGYGEAGEPGDTFESHPYHFQNPKFKLKDMPNESGVPQGNVRPNDQTHPVIVNEYGWLWLNRDGTPTTLTAELYQNLLGPDSTTAERRHLYARYLAAETEFWRCHRKCAAVLHFAALGYSRSNGQTSDHFVDAEKLIYEPEFLKYVPDSFAPVGLMINYWNEEVEAGTRAEIPVMTINDTYEAWDSSVMLRVRDGEKVAIEAVHPCRMEALGQATVVFEIQLPEQPEAFTIEATLVGVDGQPVRSEREVKLLGPA